MGALHIAPEVDMLMKVSPDSAGMAATAFLGGIEATV